MHAALKDVQISLLGVVKIFLAVLQFQRKSTEGVSFFLFALVILGNTTYGISVLLKNPDPGQGEASYIIHHLPWLIGSLGTLSLDLIVSFKATLATELLVRSLIPNTVLIELKI